MAKEARLQLSKAPSTLNQYARAVMVKGSKPKPDMQLPRIDVLLSGVKASADDVQRYADVCGFAFDGNTLPLPYPHMLAFPLHIEMMLHKAFPLALLGLVHIRNSITQHRALSVGEKFDVHCYLSGSTVSDKGLEFDIKTDVSVLGEIVWESVSTNLARMSSGEKKSSSSPRPELPKHSTHEGWTLNEDLGRQYAKVSGDSNPIHLYATTAKLFGFKGHIAHGMWTKARAIAALVRNIKSDAIEVSVSFKLPVFLPSDIELHHTRKDNRIDFDVRDTEGKKMHMQGEVVIK